MNGNIYKIISKIVSLRYIIVENFCSFFFYKNSRIPFPLKYSTKCRQSPYLVCFFSNMQTLITKFGEKREHDRQKSQQMIILIIFQNPKMLSQLYLLSDSLRNRVLCEIHNFRDSLVHNLVHRRCRHVARLLLQMLKTEVIRV